MTKKNQLTYVSLLVFFLILVALGTLNKTRESIVYDVAENTVIIPSGLIEFGALQAMDGTPSLTLLMLPMLEKLPEIAPVDIAELPHLTLPPLQDS
tara:strand:- start:483 stop:770 length:288 start_codon:yes stop_codon:yes gene_type:complete